MARSNNTSTASGSTGTWVSYSSGTATASTPYYRSSFRHRQKSQPKFHCHSCNKRHDGKGKTHPDYPEVLICDKCIKERNKYLTLVMDEERI